MIETQRLTLRLPQVSDVPEVIRYYAENRAHLQPFSPSFAPDFLEEATWFDQVRVRTLEFAAGESFLGFLFERSDGPILPAAPARRQAPVRVLGNINLTQVHRGAFQSCVLGYNLAAGEQGKGYMTEAVGGAVSFAFGTWKLHRVAASYMPRNGPSEAVLRRCGFQVEGQAPAYLFINGRWEDHVLTSITNPDWNPLTL